MPPLEPYQMEGRPGRFTTITEDQAAEPTARIREVEARLLESLKTGEVPLAPDMLFMEDVVFPVQDQECAWARLDDKLNLPWWDDHEYLFDERNAMQKAEKKPPEQKAEEYLRDSGIIT